MNKNKLRISRAVFPIFFIVLSLTLAKIIAANVLATTGNHLGEIETKIVFLKTENQALKKEISSLSSLGRVAKEAEHLGFKKASFVVYLKEEIPVALR